MKREERSQINNQTLHLKELEEVPKLKPKGSRRKEIITIGAEIDEIENGK